MELSSIATSVDLETEGVWHPVKDGFEVKIARIGNTAYNLAIQALALVSQSPSFTGSDQNISDEQLVAILAATVLVDWKGLTVEGKEVLYSVKEAIKILSDPRYHDFRRWIVRMATDAMNYRDITIEETEEK